MTMRESTCISECTIKRAKKKKKSVFFFVSSHVPEENPGREPVLVERYMLRQPTLCSANAI